MKKNNKKGFILVETLVVTLFVVTIFVFIYRITIPSIGEYEQLANYDDIDSIYYNNMYKKMVMRYANTTYIDEYLKTHTYIDIGDCNNKNLFIEGEYCNLLKARLGITDSDGKVLLTEYNIKKFKDEVETNEYFDSGALSNFREYIYTVPNHETFYSKLKASNYYGKYRMFLVRTVENADATVSKRYSNIGIYTGDNLKLLAGQKVQYDPGDGVKTFYVLGNSSSVKSTVTLILDHNLEATGVCFNTTKEATLPNTLLDRLKLLTNDWINVPYLTNYKYESASGYTINYNGYHARLLDENDILSVLGCRLDETTCFDRENAFETPFDNEKLAYFVDNLTDTNGYWTGMAIPNSYWTDPNVPEVGQYSYALAWAVKKSSISPVGTNDCTNIGIRPVIEVDKDDVVEVMENEGA